MNLKKIYYEAITVESFYDCAMDLLNNINRNTFKYKNHFCNFSDEKVLGSDVKYDPTDPEEYRQQKKLEILDHIETLSSELKECHRNYKPDEDGKLKKNNEAVLLKIGLPYYKCEDKKYSPSKYEINEKWIQKANQLKSEEQIIEILQHEHDRKKKKAINKICEKLITGVKNSNYTLPYLAVVLGEGNKHFLYILFIDKQYYKDGISVGYPNKTIRYRDINGIINKSKGWISKEAAEEIGLEKVKVFFPGEHIQKRENVYWSTKVTETWFGCKSSLEAKRNTMKSIIASIFKRFKVKLNDVKERWISLIPLRDYSGKSYTWKVATYHKIFWYLYRKNIAINGLIDTFNYYYELETLNNSMYGSIKQILNWLMKKSRLNAYKFELAIEAIRSEFIQNEYITLEGVKDIVEGFKTA